MQQGSVVILLLFAVLGGLLSMLNAALPLPESLETRVSSAAAFLSQDMLAVEVALILAFILIIGHKWRSRTGLIARLRRRMSRRGTPFV